MKRIIHFGAISFWLLSVSLMLVHAQTPLTLNTPHERATTQGQTHSFAIQLTAGQFVEISVEHKNHDLDFEWLQPDGQSARRFSSTRSVSGAERLLWIVESNGLWQLNLKLGAKNPLPQGRFAIELITAHPATASDRIRAQAAHDCEDGLVTYLAGNQQPSPIAREKFAAARSAFHSISDVAGEARALYLLGLTVAIADRKQAIVWWEESLAMPRAQKNELGETETLIKLSFLYYELGEQELAKTVCEQAIALSRQLNYQRQEFLAWGNLALVNTKLGEFDRALQNYEQALAISHSLGERASEATSLMNQGTLFNSLGENRRALAAYEQALPLLLAFSHPRNQLACYINTGNVRRDLGEYEKALKLYEQAQALAIKLNADDMLARALNPMGGVYYLQGRYQVTIAVCEKALALRAGKNDPVAQARSLYHLGRAHHQLGKLDQAKTYLSQARALQHDKQELDSESDSTHALAVIARDQGDFSEALALIESALQITETMRNKVTNTDLRMSFAAAERAKTDFYLDLLARMHERDQQAGYDIRGWQASEQQRARVLREMLRATRNNAALTSLAPLTVADAQRMLDGETALLEYALGEKSSTLWIITSQSFASFRLPARAELEAAALTWRQRLLVSQQRRSLRDAELAALALRRLILPTDITLSGKKRLVIVADGALQFIPFGALPQSAELTARSAPLLAQVEIVHLPAASTLVELRQRARAAAPKQLALFADPVFNANDTRVTKSPAPVSFAQLGQARAAAFARLPYARQEAEAILNFARDQQNFTAFDFAANRAQLSQIALHEYRYLHFATHGVFDDAQPARSGLALSLVNERGEPQDGFLRLNDVFKLKLNAEMVTLSACRTALGETVRGEGLVGLTRGFFYAGTPRVVASLWDVSDAATAELMKRFYRGLLQDKLSAAAALRAAQLSLAQEPRWAAPYYWAGFVLLGEWR